MARRRFSSAGKGGSDWFKTFSLNVIRTSPVGLAVLFGWGFASKNYREWTKPARGAKRPRVFMDVSIGGVERGRVIFELYSDAVPRTAENFRALCTHEKGYGYRSNRFHRVVPGFCVHGGDITHRGPLAGSGGRSIYGRTFADESFAVKHDRRGLLSMANAGPDTNSSQFIITLKPAPWLDDAHVVFGEVLEGMEVVEAMERGGANESRVVDCGELLPLPDDAAAEGGGKADEGQA